MTALHWHSFLKLREEKKHGYEVDKPFTRGAQIALPQSHQSGNLGGLGFPQTRDWLFTKSQHKHQRCDTAQRSPALVGHDFQALGLQQCWTRNVSALRSVWFCMFKCLMLVPHTHNVLRCTTGERLCETGTRHKLWQWESASWRWCYKKHLGRSFGACHMNYKCSCSSPWQIRSLENESLECTLWCTEKQLCRKIQNTVRSSARGSCSESRWHVQCTYQGTNVSISKQNEESKDQGYLHL